MLSSAERGLHALQGAHGSGFGWGSLHERRWINLVWLHFFCTLGLSISYFKNARAYFRVFRYFRAQGPPGRHTSRNPP